MYTVVQVVKNFRVFLFITESLFRTDYMALVRLLDRDLPPTTRIKRLILSLSKYQFKIEHKKRKKNVTADVISRLPLATAC